MNLFKNNKIFAYVSVVSLFFSLILPYYTTDYNYSYTLIGSFIGFLIIILTFWIVLFNFRDSLEKKSPHFYRSWLGKLVLNINDEKASWVPTFLILILAIILILKRDINFEYSKYGLGFYFLWIGIFSSFVHLLLGKKKNL